MSGASHSRWASVGRPRIGDGTDDEPVQQITTARQGDRPSAFFEMSAVLELPAEQVSGHLVLLRPSEVGWRMSFQALSDGNTVDASFIPESEVPAS